MHIAAKRYNVFNISEFLIDFRYRVLKNKGII